MKIKEGQSVRAYASDICRVEYELSFTGNKLEDRDKKFCLLNGLRHEYASKKQILQECIEDSFDKMVCSLEMYEADEIKSENSADSGQAFVAPGGAPQKKGKCFICGLTGHKMNKCFYNSQFNYRKLKRKA